MSVAKEGKVKAWTGKKDSERQNEVVVWCGGHGKEGRRTVRRPLFAGKLHPPDCHNQVLAIASPTGPSGGILTYWGRPANHWHGFEKRACMGSVS